MQGECDAQLLDAKVEIRAKHDRPGCAGKAHQHPQTMKRFWTDAEREYLTGSYRAGTPLLEIMAHLGRTRSGVLVMANKLGISRPVKLQSVIDYIAADTTPAGASFGQIKRALGFTAGYLNTTLNRLRSVGKAFKVGTGPTAHYAATAERAAACLPAYQAMRDAIAAERRAKHLAATEAFAARAKARMRTRLIALLADDTSPTGIGTPEAAKALGVNAQQVSDARRALIDDGKCFTLGVNKGIRMFATAQRRDECRAAVEAEEAARKAASMARKLAGQRERDNARRAEERATRTVTPKPPKPKKERKSRAKVRVAKQPTPIVLKPSTPPTKEQVAKLKWSQQEARITSETRVTICPSVNHDPRFHVDPKSVPRVPISQWGSL